jgi:hypothetical protein
MKDLVLWIFLFAFCPVPVFAYKNPRFTETTIKYAKRLFIYKNSPIGTGKLFIRYFCFINSNLQSSNNHITRIDEVLLNVEATTNNVAKPVTYALLNNDTVFQIDEYNGVLRLRDHIFNQVQFQVDKTCSIFPISFLKLFCQT